VVLGLDEGKSRCSEIALPNTGPQNSHNMDASTDQQWRIGEGFMHFDNMFLVKLASVSKGSFQPEIWVLDPAMM
jgi:hypothetical protein